MDKNRLRQILNLAAIVATIVINILANALPFNGQTTGEISDKFDVFFTPAGYVFSIWGLIYIGLLAYAIFQLLPGQRDNERLNRIGYYFILSSVANIVWIFLWHYEYFPLTVVVMLILLFSLITIYLRLNTGAPPVSANMRWLVYIPFSIYLGWISVATIANITILLDYWHWSGWGVSPEIWLVIMLIAGLGLTFAITYRRGDIAYGLVILWAYIGIAVRNAGNVTVVTVSWIAAAVAALIVAARLFRRNAG
jgi:hypothetical protein